MSFFEGRVHWRANRISAEKQLRLQEAEGLLSHTRWLPWPPRVCHIKGGTDGLTGMQEQYRDLEAGAGVVSEAGGAGNGALSSLERGRG